MLTSLGITYRLRLLLLTALLTKTKFELVFLPNFIHPLFIILHRALRRVQLYLQLLNAAFSTTIPDLILQLLNSLWSQRFVDWYNRLSVSVSLLMSYTPLSVELLLCLYFGCRNLVGSGRVNLIRLVVFLGHLVLNHTFKL